MRIITFTSSDGYSGGVRQAKYQTDGFASMGLDAYFCVPSSSPILMEGKSNYIPLPKNQKDWKKSIETLFGSDQVIVHAFHNKGLKLASYWGLFWSKKVRCVGHRGIITMPRNPLPYLSPGLQKVFPNSLACARSLRFHCPKSKIQVIPNAMALERVTPLLSKEAAYTAYGLSPEDFYIVFIGNASPVKGLDVLLEAFAQLQPPSHVKLLLVGTQEGQFAKKYQPFLDSKQAICFPHVDHVADILQLAQIFVFPSLSFDSAPNTLLEAMGLGLACIASEVGGAPEILQDKGILFPRKDDQSLAKALQDLIGDSNMRNNLKAKAIVRFAHFTVENRCKLLLEEYKKLFSA